VKNQPSHCVCGSRLLSNPVTNELSKFVEAMPTCLLVNDIKFDGKYNLAYESLFCPPNDVIIKKRR